MSFSYEELAEIRHYIHQHPELSGQEYQTTAFLKERLEEFGIRILESGLKTGLIAEIGSGQPVVALRADIDALPILEQTNLPYQSQNPGVMHLDGEPIMADSRIEISVLPKSLNVLTPETVSFTEEVQNLFGEVTRFFDEKLPYIFR